MAGGKEILLQEGNHGPGGFSQEALDVPMGTIEFLLTLHPNVIIVHGSGLQLMIDSEGENAGRYGWLEEDYEKAMQRLEEGEEISPREKKIISWLISHGTGIYHLPKSSWDARMRLTAAGALWQKYRDQGKEVKVMVVGGDNYPTLTPSIAETMREDLMRRFKIPENDIIVVGQGGNTVSDDEQIVRVMQEKGFKTAIDISSQYHEVEKSLSKGRGNYFVPAEEILEARNPRYYEIIAAIYESQTVNGLIGDQKNRARLLSIPLLGRPVYKILSKRKRGEGPEGGAPVTVFKSDDLKTMVSKKKEAVVK